MTNELTEHQIRILQLLSEGKKISDTAKLMDASQQTIKNILCIIREKLEATNTTHAVAICLRNNIIK